MKKNSYTRRARTVSSVGLFPSKAIELRSSGSSETCPRGPAAIKKNKNIWLIESRLDRLDHSLIFIRDSRKTIAVWDICAKKDWGKETLLS